MKVLQSDTFLGTRGLLHLCSAYVSSSNVYVYWDGKVMKGLFIISAVDKGAFVFKVLYQKTTMVLSYWIYIIKRKDQSYTQNDSFAVCVNLKQFLVGHAKMNRL